MRRIVGGRTALLRTVRATSARAGTTETAAVVAELEKMTDEPTLFGPRTFSSELHHQNRARYLIVETNAGKPGVVDEWTISEAIPVADLLK